MARAGVLRQEISGFPPPGVGAGFHLGVGSRARDSPNQKNLFKSHGRTSNPMIQSLFKGFSYLGKIRKKLREIGNPADYPCAVFSKGTTKDQLVIVGTLEDIVEKSVNIPTPAMIIVGKVVELREQLKWFNN